MTRSKVTGAGSTVGLLALALLVAGPVASAGSGPLGEPVAEQKTQILCLDDSGAEYRYKTSPVQCAIFNDGIFAGGVNLKRIRWKHWGENKARGRAIECGFHLPCADIRAKVKAFRSRERCGHLVYTRIQAKTRHGNATPRPAACPGGAF